MKMASRSLDLITKKNKFARAAHFFLISKKTNLHVSRLFFFFLPLFCTTTMPFCTTETSKFLVTHYFHGGIVVCTYQSFCFLCSCSLLFFHCRSFSPSRQHFLFSHHRFEIFTFSAFNEIRLPSSFSVFHVSVNIKNNVEKDTTLLGFFLSKSPGGHAIFFRCIWVAIPVDRVILYWCTCGADGRSVGWAVYGHVITIFSRNGRFTQLWASARPWSSAI